MTKQRYSRAVLCVALCLILLFGGFGIVSVPTAGADGAEIRTEPDSVPFSDATLPEEQIEVTNVDELLAAIGPDRVIRLADGEYNLTEASAYIQGTGSDFYDWDTDMDGAEIFIYEVNNLYLIGSGADRCSIVTEPRYANVLRFQNCSGIRMSDLTVGHTNGEGYCSGGVLYFRNCEDLQIVGCDLYGCGTVGITAENCHCLTAEKTTIRDCSYGAIDVRFCFDVRFADGRIVNCGISKEFYDGWMGFHLVYAESCTGVALLNSVIQGNVSQILFTNSSSLDYLVSGCQVQDNTVGEFGEYEEFGRFYTYSTGGMFLAERQPIKVVGTEFRNNELLTPLFDRRETALTNPVVDTEGNPLDEAELAAMQLVQCEDYKGPEEETPPELEISMNTEGLREIHVSTADEFLAAIGSNTVLYVDTEILDFSDAKNYGGYGGNDYYWIDVYDGPGLVISGVHDLQILGQGKDRTVLQATPRYADVLAFENCENICIGELTAGHLEGVPGYCAGDVLEFTSCRGVKIQACGLFGCGVNAIVAQDCSGFSISETEMYSCSQYGAMLWNCSNFSFQGCEIHDCECNCITLIDGCYRIFWNDTVLRNGQLNEV